jgi:Uma2 family endonuclease
MSYAIQSAEAARLTAREFRIFQQGRPDSERWELIDGIPVMMTPPSIDHNRIASNLEVLLNNVFEEGDALVVAVQRPGLELGIDEAVVKALGLTVDYRPEPDVAVIDNEPAPGRRFVNCAYLLAEVVSSTDDDRIVPTGERWIEAKIRLYQAHRHCNTILAVEQDRIEVRVFRRTADGWLSQILTDAEDELSLPEHGLRCLVGALYANTHLRPRQKQGYTA